MNLRHLSIYIFSESGRYPYSISLPFIYSQSLKWLNPMASSVKVSSCFVIRVFSIFSMSVILACLVKSCHGSEKCLSTGIAFSFVESILWLFVRRFEGVSHFPI